MLLEQIDFIKNVYVADVLAFGTGPLLPLARAGVGAGPGNYMAYGAFEQADGTPFFKPGVILHGKIDDVLPLDPGQITEAVTYSFYRYKSDAPLHPSDGETAYDLEKPDAYSFIKAPRYMGLPMEVGPLARMLIMKEPTVRRLMEQYAIRPGAVARHVARAVETQLLAEAMLGWVDELADLIARGETAIHDSEHWEPPRESQGAGLSEAPRGALGHWIRIRNGVIDNYQMVVPSTWNFSPRDERGQRGPVEEALIGVPVPDLQNPVNVVRVIRSVDPCIACAIHLIVPDRGEVARFEIGL